LFVVSFHKKHSAAIAVDEELCFSPLSCEFYRLLCT
jgi:hypothetical protein